MTIQKAFKNDDIFELKKILKINNSLNLRSIIKISKEPNYINLLTYLCEELPKSIPEVVNYACHFDDVNLLIHIIEKFNYKNFVDDSSSHFKMAIRGNAKKVSKFLLDNFYIDLNVNSHELFKECIIEKHNELFEILYNSKSFVVDTRTLVGIILKSYEQGSYEIIRIVSKNKNIQNIVNNEELNIFSDELKNIIKNINKIKDF